MQHALAREYGLAGWAALKKNSPESARRAAANTDELVSRFLENACPDHHVRGGPAHVRALHTAMRLLERYPEIRRDSFYTAVVCGDLDGSAGLWRSDPGWRERATAASRTRGRRRRRGRLVKGLGPKGGSRCSISASRACRSPAVDDNAVAIARVLLDHGADPNAYFMAGGSRYTPLVGVIGEGEEDRPPHPRRDELVRLLLERGAERVMPE